MHKAYRQKYYDPRNVSSNTSKQCDAIISVASVTTTRHVIAIYVQTIKVLTILPLSPADRKEVLEAQNLIDTIKKTSNK